MTPSGGGGGRGGFSFSEAKKDHFSIDLLVTQLGEYNYRNSESPLGPLLLTILKTVPTLYIKGYFSHIKANNLKGTVA